MFLYLNNNVDKYNQERICQVEKEPLFYWLDALGVRQRSGHRQVDGGQHHHTSDVHNDYQVIL